jgi:hypothetical protein
MKILSTKTHACLDYFSAVIMICGSLLFNLNETENYILTLTGSIILLYSAVTNYEFGVLHLLGLHNHFKLDIICGCILLLSPWFFPFSTEAYTIFISCGVFKIITGVATTAHTAPSNKYTGSFRKLYDMPGYGKMEKFPRMKI